MTNTEHLLPHQPDERLDAEGVSLYCHILCAAFLKEFGHRGENCRILQAQGLLGGWDLLVLWISRARIIPVLVVPSPQTEGARAAGIPWSFPACRTGVSRWCCPWMGTQQLGTSILWPNNRK